MYSKEDELDNLVTKDTDNGVNCDSQSLKRSSDNASKVSVEENINDPTMTVHVTTNTMYYVICQTFLTCHFLPTYQQYNLKRLKQV